MKIKIHLLALVSAVSTPLVAQGPPTPCEEVLGSTRTEPANVASTLNTLYGDNGLRLPNTFHNAHFQQSAQENLSPLNSRLATQLTQLPIASPASGFVYSLDASTGAYSRTAQSFGPILTERSETIGRNRLFVGFSYQNFDFDKLDGLDLQNLNSVFTHSTLSDCERDIFTSNADAIEGDVIVANTSIRLRVHQFTSFFTYGLTNSVDVSLAVPVLSTNMNVSSNAQIRRLGTAGFPDANPPINPIGARFPHTFTNGIQGVSNDVTTQLFPQSASATGIGDLTVRLKGNFYRWENGGLAAATDIRLPTGEELDFLGSGSFGFRPFVIVSHNFKRVSGHANLGYQVNGDSVLGGNPVTGVKGDLPDAFTYAVGTDVGVTDDVTLAFDFLGAHLGESDRLLQQEQTFFGGYKFANLAVTRESLTINNGSVGAKVNLGRRILLTFNAIFALNSAGLRDNVSPLIGISFTP